VIVLDTHAWLWWMSSPERLSDDAAASIADASARDPADRFIYATARSVGSPLVTRDARIRVFAPSTTLW
jgi:PIN domain nuclease of toxin-antitoxin system